ncbi:MAG: hypothetical protein K0R34_101 [Herbinix sp.]|nr:hypothetical protein [Herbinix sp.]
MIDKMKDAKDNVMGKMKETAGKMIRSDKLELSGKLQSFQSKVGDGIDNLKDEMADKANEVIDSTKLDNKNNQS